MTSLILVQVPPFTLFNGLCRDNLDPTSAVSDAKLWETLEVCHLKEVVTKAGGFECKNVGGRRELIPRAATTPLLGSFSFGNGTCKCNQKYF